MASNTKKNLFRRCVNYISQTFTSGLHAQETHSFNRTKENLRDSPSEIRLESDKEGKDICHDESKSALVLTNSSSGEIVGNMTRKNQENTGDKPNIKDANSHTLDIENEKEVDSNIKEQTSAANKQRELEILRLQEKVLRLQEKICKLQKKVSTLQGVSLET